MSGSFTLRLVSSLNGFDSVALATMYKEQHIFFFVRIQSIQTGYQSYSYTSPYKVSDCFLVIVTALKCRDVGEYWAAELKKFQNLDAAHSQLNKAWVKGYPQSYSVFKIISLFASKHFYSRMLSYFLTLGTWIGCDQVKHMIAWSLRSNLKKLKANSDELKSRADSWKDYCIVSVENSNFYIFLRCNHPPHVAAAKALHLNVH